MAVREDQLRVVAGILVGGDRVLACRRSPQRTAGGRWEFPGGKIDDGETPQQALVRELAEELGLSVTVGELFDRSTTAVDAVSIDLACYLIADHSPEPTASTDHDQLRWQPLRALSELDWAEPDRPAVGKLSAGRGRPVGHSEGSPDPRRR